MILAATGNENASTISYPAINTYVIGVGAASPCGDRKRSSSSSGRGEPGRQHRPQRLHLRRRALVGLQLRHRHVQDAAGAVDIIAPTILPTTDISGSGGYEPGDYEPFFNGTSLRHALRGRRVRADQVGEPDLDARPRSATSWCNTAQDVVNVESGARLGPLHAATAWSTPRRPSAAAAARCPRWPPSPARPPAAALPAGRQLHRPVDRHAHELELDLRRRRQLAPPRTRPTPTPRPASTT